MFDAADIAVMLDAVGEPATTAHGPLAVSFFAPGQQIDVFDGAFTVTDPTALVSSADIPVHNLVGDPDGTVITISGKQYQIRTIVPEGDGFSLLEMREV